MNKSRKYPLVSACLTPDLADTLNGLWHLVGNTRLVELHYLYKGREGRIFVKCEQDNLSGSIKDRAVLYILNKAYLNGQIHPFDTVIESFSSNFSNNFGIATAHIAKTLGHAVLIYTLESKRKHCEALIARTGAEVALIDEVMAERLHVDYQPNTLKMDELNMFSPKQFKGLYATEIHERSTGPEIWQQLETLHLKPHAFVAGVGSGDTLTGIGKYFKSMDRNTAIYPVGNFETLALNGTDCIAELSTLFVQDVAREIEVQETTYVRKTEALMIAHKLAKQTGLATGITSGANLLGAIKVKEALGPEAVVVTLLFDNGRKTFANSGTPQMPPVGNEGVSQDISFTGYRIIPRLKWPLMDAYL